ncbi:MAG: hypothetical protein KKF33_19920 [Alphaproteobacteria bacterium]|nr:hypothetical protein [Alphaproteobacteria bacterium]
MRVPSIGMTLEERRHLREIVAEGYALAERLLANYQDPAPGALTQFANWCQKGWSRVRDAARASARS